MPRDVLDDIFGPHMHMPWSPNAVRHAPAEASAQMAAGHTPGGRALPEPVLYHGSERPMVPADTFFLRIPAGAVGNTDQMVLYLCLDAYVPEGLRVITYRGMCTVLARPFLAADGVQAVPATLWEGEELAQAVRWGARNERRLFQAAMEVRPELLALESTQRLALELESAAAQSPAPPDVTPAGQREGRSRVERVDPTPQPPQQQQWQQPQHQQPPQQQQHQPPQQQQQQHQWWQQQHPQEARSLFPDGSTQAYHSPVPRAATSGSWGPQAQVLRDASQPAVSTREQAHRLGWDQASVSRAERWAALPQGPVPAQVTFDTCARAHGVFSYEQLDELWRLSHAIDAFGRGDLAAGYGLLNERLHELCAMATAADRGTEEQTRLMVRRQLHARALDSQAGFIVPLLPDGLATHQPPIAYRDAAAAPFGRLQPFGLPRPKVETGYVAKTGATEGAQGGFKVGTKASVDMGKPPSRGRGKGQSGGGRTVNETERAAPPHGEVLTGFSNPDSRCAFNAVATARRAVQHATAGTIHWPKQKLDPVEIRRYLAIQPGVPVDAVEGVWSADDTAAFDIECSIACEQCGYRSAAQRQKATALRSSIADHTPGLEFRTGCPQCEHAGQFCTKVVGTPKIVAVWMTRVTDESSGRVSRRRVALPLELPHGDAKYDLSVVLHHKGSTTNGHWWSEVLHEGRWHKVDDAQVSETNLPRSSATASLLIYIRGETSQTAVPATDDSRCKAAGKGGPCRSQVVHGYDRCAAHLYGETGTGTCGRVTTAGKRCPQANAKGMTACAMHVLGAAEAQGFGPPVPGKGLTSGPRLGKVVVTAQPEGKPPRPQRPTPPQAPLQVDTAALARPELPSAFRGGHLRMPTVAALKGHALASLEMLESAAIPAPALKGLSLGQRSEHRRIWRRLIAIPEELRELQLPVAALTVLQAWRASSSWCPTTWAKVLGSAMGALARASLYTTSAMDLPVTQCAVFKDAVRSAKKEEHAFLTKPPKPCTKEQVVKAVAAARSNNVQEQLALAWLTAGRVGCTLQLKREDVQLGPNGTMSVQFRRGKGVAMGAPYTVHTKCPPEWQPILNRLLSRTSPGGFLWPYDNREARTAGGKDVAKALKEIDPQLEQRSLRRGALQQMADAGVDDATLMTFSGHRRVETLHRYLDWGRKGRSRAARGQDAARLLDGGRRSA